MIMRKYVIVTCLIVFVISTVFCFEEKTEVRAIARTSVFSSKQKTVLITKTIKHVTITYFLIIIFSSPYRLSKTADMSLDGTFLR